jgi:hypothetical protein
MFDIVVSIPMRTNTTHCRTLQISVWDILSGPFEMKGAEIWVISILSVPFSISINRLAISHNEVAIIMSEQSTTPGFCFHLPQLFNPVTPKFIPSK